MTDLMTKLKQDMKDMLVAEPRLEKLSSEELLVKATIKHYCNSLKTWMDCWSAEDEDEEEFFQELYMKIVKSDFLHRLIYEGQWPRTEKCPIHKGHWSGIPWIDDQCPHGFGHTGWLPFGQTDNE